MRKLTLLFIFLLISLLLVSAQPKPNLGSLKPNPKTMTHDFNFEKLPLDFIVNKGQVDKKAAFYARTSFYTLWVTKEGLVFDSTKKVAENNFKRDVSRMIFLGANSKPVIAAFDKTRHRVNYFKGSDKSRWYTDIPTSTAVVYRNLYNRINLKVYGIQQEIEYDWIVEPKGDPGDIRIQYKNVLDSAIDPEGNLVITTSFGKLTHKKPISYQWSKGNQVPVSVSYKKLKKHVYGFAVGDYDKSKELVIDPAVLVYSTYFGGTGPDEYVYDFTTDGEGLVYFTGATNSNPFPTTYNAYDRDFGGSGNFDVFVSVLDTTQDGSSGLIYSTYMGNNGVDQGQGITVDANGIIYVTGTAWDADYPYFPTTDSTTSRGGYDIFVAKFDPSESGTDTLLFSTLIGGSQEEKGRRIAVDSSGNIYIVGYTRSSQSDTNKFPLSTNAYQDQIEGWYDLFLIKMSSSGTITYSTYFGGGSGSTDESSDWPYVALDSNGYVYMVGLARADDLPIKPNPGALKTSRTNFDGFISIFDPSQSTAADTLVYSTFFGGSGQDQIDDIVIDDTDVYITGKTDSNPGTNGFPITTGAYQSTRGFVFDAFITKFDYSSSQLNILYSSYLGGNGTDWGRAINVDTNGDVYVAGRTQSSDFPTNNSYQSCVSGNAHAFVSILDLSAGSSGLIFSSCVGGSNTDVGLLAGYDSSGNVIVAGSTLSTNYPVTTSPAAFQSSLNGALDVFITVLDPGI